MVRSMLTTEEMRMKLRDQALPIDSTSSSSLVLLANGGNSTRHSNVALENVNKPCFNFNKGFCRFGEHCKFPHNGVHGNSSLWSTSNARPTSSSTILNMTQEQMMALIQSQQQLLAQYGYTGTNGMGQCEYPSVSDGDCYSIPVIDSGHSTLPAPHRPLYLNNILITPNVVKNLIYMLLRCDSTGDLYPITKPSTIRHAFITSQYT
ncbi:ribonuclease H-like domain-containing protein [Tanacetum coccineum]